MILSKQGKNFPKLNGSTLVPQISLGYSYIIYWYLIYIVNYSIIRNISVLCTCTENWRNLHYFNLVYTYILQFSLYNFYIMLCTILKY